MARKPQAQVVGRVARLAMHFEDWEYAALQFQLGVKTVNVIADEIGVTKERLFDYLHKEKVGRLDLSAKIQERRTNMLAADALPENAVLPVSEEDIISINATLQSSLILTHRQDVGRARRVVMQILSELEFQTDAPVELAELGDMLRKEDDKGRDDRNDLYNKIISTAGRVDSLKKLSESLKILVMLERQAFGIRDDYEDPRVKNARLEKNANDMNDNSFSALQERFNKVNRRQSAATATDAVIVDDKSPATA